MPIYRLEGMTPSIADSAYVHPSAEIIGDVTIEAHCYIAPGAVLRGDFGHIHVHHHSNVQDNCVLHSFPDQDCIVSAYGHIGHAAVLHGCVLEDNVLIGMNSVIMDQAQIAKNTIVAANSFVPSNFTCEPGALIVGSPATVKRTLSEREINWKSEGTDHYVQLASRYLNSCELVQREDLSDAPDTNQRASVNFQYKPDKSD